LPPCNARCATLLPGGAGTIAGDHACDHRFELCLRQRERPRRRRADLDLDGDGKAAALERADDPVESAERHRTLAIGLRVLRPVDRSQQLLQHDADVRVSPGRRVGHRHIHDVGRREVVAPQPDLDLQTHPLDCSAAIQPAPPNSA